MKLLQYVFHISYGCNTRHKRADVSRLSELKNSMLVKARYIPFAAVAMATMLFGFHLAPRKLNISFKNIQSALIEYGFLDCYASKGGAVPTYHRLIRYVVNKLSS